MLSEKNVAALTFGPKYLLGKFVNLPNGSAAVNDPEPAKEFREQFGDLYPGLAPEDYWERVAEFLQAWQAKEESELRSVSDNIEGILNRSSLTDDIFFQIVKDALSPRSDGSPIFAESLLRVEPSSGNLVIEPGTLIKLLKMCAAHPDFKAVLTVDFSTGELRIKPQTLLDYLTAWLLAYHDELAICAWKGCKHPYYVKTHGRQNFCCHDCANYGRKMSHLKSWHKNKKKWRKQHKTARRHSKARSLRVT